ncbi:hypothetical protein [Deinococcus sp.]|uniref:hypothetical protein n=1 Tax=Deinococcus sp. TaxID=47478 RepID=UPI0025BCC6B3|nr:hypothetical protein [Deinococcus sp.]
MTDEKKQAERPDYWISETTTPGLLVQTDMNSGETEPVLAGATAQRRTSALTNLAPNFQEGLNRMAEKFNSSDKAGLEETLAPLKDLQDYQDLQTLHDFIFPSDDVDDAERNRRLHLLAREMERAAGHIRRVMTER